MARPPPICATCKAMEAWKCSRRPCPKSTRGSSRPPRYRPSTGAGSAAMAGEQLTPQPEEAMAAAHAATNEGKGSSSRRNPSEGEQRQQLTPQPSKGEQRQQLTPQPSENQDLDRDGAKTNLLERAMIMQLQHPKSMLMPQMQTTERTRWAVNRLHADANINHQSLCCASNTVNHKPNARFMPF